jgi:hypothetical protein
VRCEKPIRGDKVILETTRNEYLSISGIEVYTASCKGNGCGGVPKGVSMMRSGSMQPMRSSSTRTMKTSSSSRMGGMIPMGMPMGMMRRTRREPAVFRMSNRKATLVNAEQNPKYHPTAYSAAEGLKNTNSFTHTKNVKGATWKASFKGGEQYVWKVRVRNRVNCCGDRLRGTKISIGGEVCGQIN